jgi:hypothetical protein
MNPYFETLGPHDNEDGDSMFLRNVAIYLRVYMASKPRRTTSNPYFITNCFDTDIGIKVDIFHH